MGITQIINYCLHALFCDVYTFSCLCMLYISFSSTCVLFEGMTRELLAHPLTKDNRLESKSSLASFCQVMVGYCCNHSAKNETVALKQTYFPGWTAAWQKDADGMIKCISWNSVMSPAWCRSIMCMLMLPSPAWQRLTIYGSMLRVWGRRREIQGMDNIWQCWADVWTVLTF